MVLCMGRKRSPLTVLPTDAELEILQILWAGGPQTVREVHSALRDKQTGYTTVLKQMQVMAEKGLVERSERFRAHVYSAAQPREATQRSLIDDLLRRAFSGSARNLVLGALSARSVSSEEIAEIKRAIRDYEKEQR
jgi:BlaI family transcriptional regulator, penicillinase repressor